MISIYIVDDEPMAVRYLEYLLENSGAEYTIAGSATNSVRALSEILELRPDIVFTDISMPVMDGLKLAERVLAKLNCRVYLLTSYEDFHYAVQGVKIGVADYILKNQLTEELLRDLIQSAGAEIAQARRQRRLVLESEIRDFLTGSLELAQDALPDRREGQRYALLAFFEPVCFSMNRAEAAEERAQEAEVLEGLTWPEGTSCGALTRMGRGEYCAIIEISASVINGPRSVFKIADAVLERLNASRPGWKCLQSDLCVRYTGLPAAYQRAQAAKDYLYAWSDQSIFLPLDLKVPAPARPEDSEEYLERLYQLLSDVDHAGAIALTESFFSYCRASLGVWDYMENMRRLYQLIRRCILKHTLSTDSLGMANAYWRYEDLERALLNCEELYFESVEKTDVSTYSEHVQRAVDYIRLSYGGDISVASIAEAIGISEGHLRRLFKQELNTSVIDFLTDCRIDRVKALMRDERLSLTEIWRQSGFSSLQYMSQVFRKREGMLPKAYMKKVREEKAP